MGLVKSDDDFYLSKRGHRFTKITYTNELQSWLIGGHRISSWGVIGLAGIDQSMIWFKIAEEISQYTGSTFKISTSSYVILRCEFFVKNDQTNAFIRYVSVTSPSVSLYQYSPFIATPILQWSLNQNHKRSIQGNAFQNVVCSKQLFCWSLNDLNMYLSIKFIYVGIWSMTSTHQP